MMLITKEDVGRKVVHRDGSVSEITEWYGNNLLYPVKTTHEDAWFSATGEYCAASGPSKLDIILFVDVQERKMKHVIAGEAQHDVLEWRLNINDGYVFMEARKPGEDWRAVVWVSENGVISTNLEGNHKALGLKVAK